MNPRITKSLVAAALTLPLLAGCGGGDESAAPAGSAAPASSAAAPASSAAASPAASPSSASPSPSATSDPAAEKKDVQDASEKFVRTVLTIGYPDKDFDSYAKHVKPLMTSDGYASLTKADSKKEAAEGIKKLYAQKARTVPKLDGDPKVSDLTESSATAKVRYRNQAQLRSGDGWKTIDKGKASTATVELVKDGDDWLVEDAR